MLEVIDIDQDNTGVDIAGWWTQAAGEVEGRLHVDYVGLKGWRLSIDDLRAVRSLLQTLGSTDRLDCLLDTIDTAVADFEVGIPAEAQS